MRSRKGAKIAALRVIERGHHARGVGESTQSNDRGISHLPARAGKLLRCCQLRDTFDTEQKNGQVNPQRTGVHLLPRPSMRRSGELQVRPVTRHAQTSRLLPPTFSIRGNGVIAPTDLAQNVAIFVHGSGELGARGGAEPNEKGSLRSPTCSPELCVLAAAAAMNDPQAKVPLQRTPSEGCRWGRGWCSP